MIFFDKKEKSKPNEKISASQEYIEEMSFRVRDSLNSISGLADIATRNINEGCDREKILMYMSILQDSVRDIKDVLDDCFNRYIDSVDDGVENKNVMENDYEILNNLRVMVVDDNEINQMVVKEILASHGAIVTLCDNGRIAVDKLLNSITGTYDVILMDIQMPEMDGYEATDKIRNSNHPQATTIPIIAVTAEAFAEDIQMALKSGMNAHVAKPYSLESIVAAIKSVKVKKVLAI